MGHAPAHAPAQEAELEDAQCKAAKALKAARARKLAGASDDMGLDKLKSKPKKVMLSELLSSPKKTSAGKLVVPS